MENVSDTLKAISATSSRSEKEARLKAALLGEDPNPMLPRVLQAAMDPYRTFGVKNFPVPPCAPGDEPMGAFAGETQAWEELLELCGSLQARRLSGNAALVGIEEHLKVLPSPLQDWHVRVLRKDLGIGMEAKSVNKVCTGLIPSFEVSLAAKVEDLGAVKFPVWCDTKLDGHRCVAFKRGDVVTLLNRKGHEVTARLPEIVQELRSLPGSFVLDGEAMGKDWNETQTVMSTDKPVNRSRMMYHVFDHLALNVWDNRSGSPPYSVRRQNLDQLLSAPLLCRHVKAVPGKLVLDVQEVQRCFQEALAAGHEGVMLKDPKAPYQWKRSKSILKLKPTETWEGQIVDWVMGDANGRHAKTFGAFLVRFKSGGPSTFVGGGYSDEERASIFANLSRDADAYEGRIVEVNGQEMTKDGLVRFPIFVRFRSSEDI